MTQKWGEKIKVMRKIHDTQSPFRGMKIFWRKKCCGLLWGTSKTRVGSKIGRHKMGGEKFWTKPAGKANNFEKGDFRHFLEKYVAKKIDPSAGRSKQILVPPYSWSKNLPPPLWKWQILRPGDGDSARPASELQPAEGRKKLPPPSYGVQLEK